MAGMQTNTNEALLHKTTWLTLEPELCSGNRSQTSVDRRKEAKTSEFWILACCPKGMPLTYLNGNAFCCGGRGHCFGNICTCNGNKVTGTISTQMSLIKSVS
ncbi:hypothetical protein OS493_015025 [Desmophyllum pertusum]|uniref:Uncharacterized protein n=1 Tax=Desmophyllum pertusum TaxID=174260 RepID=A0A9X0A251_9CNID|nr:hypothetical protein OS493_015025 [Desmophyllum pertusum]